MSRAHNLLYKILHIEEDGYRCSISAVPNADKRITLHSSVKVKITCCINAISAEGSTVDGNIGITTCV